MTKNPFKYIFSFYGLVDFLAIFPFYLRGTLDMRMLRAFRIFRVFRALKLIRYNKALRRFDPAARIVKEEVVLFLIVTFRIRIKINRWRIRKKRNDLLIFRGYWIKKIQFRRKCPLFLKAWKFQSKGNNQSFIWLPK